MMGQTYCPSKCQLLVVQGTPGTLRSFRQAYVPASSSRHMQIDWTGLVGSAGIEHVASRLHLQLLLGIILNYCQFCQFFILVQEVLPC